MARKANNHFGIKCGDGWSGVVYYKRDDDYDPNGHLKESCFRSYPTPEDSFEDHSAIIASPGKAHRYGSLFELALTNYKGWAIGLQQAGYATDTAYAKRLISLIRKYRLFEYDLLETIPDELPEWSASSPVFTVDDDVPFTLASGRETAHDIAYRTYIPVGDLLVYNEDLPIGYFIPKGQKVYMGERSFTARLADSCKIQSLDVVYDILAKLLNDEKSNSFEPGGLPIEIEEPPKPTAPHLPPLYKARFHIVSKGDTLWSIARRYNTTVKVLKGLNQLNDNLILPGMELQVW